jgi:pimeloyl-ACP methyl ester carboxylesterase
LKVEEIKIDLPGGGFIRGKWWGDKSIRPILCLHGWQDNAGTFDRLIPLLPKHFSYLAIDFPGHGRSSWLPDGVVYHTFSYLHIINHVLKEYKWNKIGLIGHSLSSRLLYIFAAVFPEKVDFVIGLDNLKPLALETHAVISALGANIESYQIISERTQHKSEAPAYTIDEMIERLCNGTNGSVTKEIAPFLLRRNITPSIKFPGKFNFARDGRLKFSTFPYYPHNVTLEMTNRITMPYLFITGSGTPEFEKKKYTYEVLHSLATHHNFHYFIVDSNSHHFHLLEPEKISHVMSKFIEKYCGSEKNHHL